jgi:hypothetical protein
MPELSTHLTFIADPGHGWLKVPLAEIAALGIEGEISPYSFIKGNYAYLEEDCDCPSYLEARAGQGYPQPAITEQYVDRFERPYLAFHDPSLDATFWDKLRR